MSGLGTGLTDLLTFAGLQLTRVNRPKTFDTEPDDMSHGRLAAKKPLYRHLNNLLTITLQGYVAVYTVPHLDPVQVNDKQKRRVVWLVGVKSLIKGFCSLVRVPLPTVRTLLLHTACLPLPSQIAFVRTWDRLNLTDLCRTAVNEG